MKNDDVLTEGLMKIIVAENLTELAFEAKDFKINLKRDYVPPKKKETHKEKEANGHQTKVATPVVVAGDFVEICSNGIGTFKSIQKNKKSALVPGLEVETGDEIGYISVMGVVTPVVAEVSGIIEEVLVADDTIVDFAKPILKLKK